MKKKKKKRVSQDRRKNGFKTSVANTKSTRKARQLKWGKENENAKLDLLTL